MKAKYLTDLYTTERLLNVSHKFHQVKSRQLVERWYSVDMTCIFNGE